MTTFILLSLGILGFILVFVGLCWLVVAVRRHPHLLRISSIVLSVHKKYDTAHDKVTFYPNIGYTTPEGKQVNFRSSIGDTFPDRRMFPAKSPWTDGQRIDVYHDPGGVLAPCIATLWNLYGWALVLFTGGILLLMVVVNKWNQLGGP